MAKARKRLIPNKVKFLAISGGALAIVAIAFEFARIRPAYQFIVRPWSIRGYETTQGWIIAAAGVVLIGLALIDSEVKPLMWVRRLHMLAAVVAWGFITFAAGSLRSALATVQLQAEQIPSSGEPFTGIAAPYKDIQVTSGWMLAVAGTVLAFIGAVGMWAVRRDQRLAQQRAERQRKAAEESARELAEASL